MTLVSYAILIYSSVLYPFLKCTLLVLKRTVSFDLLKNYCTVLLINKLLVCFPVLVVRKFHVQSSIRQRKKFISENILTDLCIFYIMTSDTYPESG